MYSAGIEGFKSYDSGGVKKASYEHTPLGCCQAACPLRMEIREYVDLIVRVRML